MGSVYVYDAEGLDTSTTGLCGELVPVHCEHEELAGGLSTVTMQHPFDEWGKWQHLEVGNLLKCDVRCRTAPAIDENDLLITSVERWTVRTTLTSTQRRVFKSKKGSKKNGSLIMGREVFVLQQVTTGSLTRWQIKFEVQRKRKKKIIYTWKTGWIENKDNILDTKLEDVTTPGGDMEAVCPSVETAPQLFRINRIEKDAERGVSVTAEHVSYDLKYNVTRFNYTGQLTGLQCLKGGTATIGGQTVTVDDGIMGSLDFDTEVEAYTNIGSVRVAADYINVNPTAALLDPKTGFLAKYGAELIRDDWTMYFVTRAGRDNGMRIEYGKNLTGVQFEVSEEDLYTAVLPLGVNKNGSVLYLADDSNPGSISNYVLSEHAALYPFMRVKVLECDATVEKTKKGVTLAVARARMLAEAQAQFAADNPGRIDVPEMSARVNFVELGDTVEYEKYKGLESVFLYDTVTVADAPHGIEIKAEVQETRWDVLGERMIEIVVGNVSPGNVWSWAVERVEAPEPEPVVWVTGGPLRYKTRLVGQGTVADTTQTVEQFTANYWVWATSGGEPVSPTLGDLSGVSLPAGMTLEVGDLDATTKALPVTLTLAAGAKPLAWAGGIQGFIGLPVADPAQVNLNLEYGPESAEVALVSDTPPENPTIGTLWTSTEKVLPKGAISYPVMQYAEVLDWAPVDAADITEGSGAPGPEVETPYYHDTVDNDYYAISEGEATVLEPVEGGAPTAEGQCTVDEGQMSVSQVAADWVQTNDVQAAMEGNVTPGVYPYFRIDSEFGLLIGNAQIAYDPEKGLGIWPYEWGE